MLKPSKKLNTKAIPYEKCIAKKNDKGKTISVYQHCISSGFVAEEMLEYDRKNNPCRSKMYPENIGYIVSIHDIGKCSDQFTYEIGCDILDGSDNTVYEELGNKTKSEYFKSCCITRFSHNEIGARVYERMFPNRKKISDIIRYHHGKYVDNSKFEIRGEEFELDEAHMTQYGKFEKEISNIFEYEKDESYEEINELFVLGLTMICDHIASNEEFFPLELMREEELRERAKRAVSSIMPNTEVIKGLSFSDIFGFNMRSIQKDFCSFTNQKGKYIFEADAGIGKTESSLYSAYDSICRGESDGIAFLLPTCTISNKIYERVVSFMDKISNNGNVSLVHGKSYIYKNEIFDITDSVSKLSDWFDNSGHQLLPNFIVGTVDQGLQSVMKTKWSAVKLFSLCGKTIIIDEIHAYDMYTFELICSMSNILHDMFGCTVIGMSASLPSTYRHRFLKQDGLGGAFPLIMENIGRSITPQSGMSKTVSMMYGGMNNAITTAISKANQGLSVLWIANTVNSAQLIYTILSGMTNNVEIGLIHSRNTTPNRCKNEDYWIETMGKDKSKRGVKGKILISTQVVEMSVNIDSDYLISELCPLDSLIQRIGRLFRYLWSSRKVKIPEMMIYTNESVTDCDYNDKKRFEECIGTSKMVYPKYLLLKTLEFLRNRTVINVPSDTQIGIESIYSRKNDFEDDMEWEYYNEMVSDNEDRITRADRCLINKDDSDYISDEMSTRDINNGYQKTIVLTKKIFHESKDMVSIEPYDTYYHYKGKKASLNSDIKIGTEDRKINPFHRVIFSNNTVNGVPLGRNIEHSEYDKLVSRYYYDEPYVMIVNDDNSITSPDGTETGLMYLPKYGVVSANTLNLADNTIEDISTPLNGEF